MKNKPPETTNHVDDLERMNATLKRMLATPPKKHETAGKSKKPAQKGSGNENGSKSPPAVSKRENE